MPESDVSLELSSVCVVDAQGKIVREVKVASEPEALVAFFAEFARRPTKPQPRLLKSPQPSLYLEVPCEPRAVVQVTRDYPCLVLDWV